MKWIVAGNKEQADAVARANGWQKAQYRFVWHPDRLRGVQFHPDQIVFVGTWFLRGDALEMVTNARLCARLAQPRG